MAAMPWAGGMRERAVMMKAEKAKKTPAIRPLPSAATKVSAKRTLPIISDSNGERQMIAARNLRVAVCHASPGRHSSD